VKWQVISDRGLYRDEWLDIRVAEVELPDGHRFGHRWIRTPPGAGVVAVDGGDQVLLIWRHRFITDTWGWEIPMGKIEEGELPAHAAAREFEEETGWRAGRLRHLIDVQPTPGLSNSVHHIFQAGEAAHVGSPTDTAEADRVGWVPLAQVPSLTARGDITSGSTLAALLYVLSQTRAAR
jgi:8-oxo-dGTP pyrophosphatase MutT (NUDIX family)